MKKDIEVPEVKDVFVAVVEEENELGAMVHNVYLINQSKETLEGVLVSSKGYGRNVNTGEKVETSMLRHFLDVVSSESYKKIEPIIEDVLGLNNEYWVSFFINNTMFDKKYIFVAESIHKDNYVNISLINKKGVVIK